LEITFIQFNGNWDGDVMKGAGQVMLSNGEKTEGLF